MKQGLRFNKHGLTATNNVYQLLINFLKLPGLSTRELTKLNKTWFFGRFTIGLSQVLGRFKLTRFTDFVQTFINQPV
jgi:hypothetical protein